VPGFVKNYAEAFATLREKKMAVVKIRFKVPDPSTRPDESGLAQDFAG
jgi:hypothetical protein